MGADGRCLVVWACVVISHRLVGRRVPDMAFEPLVDQGSQFGNMERILAQLAAMTQELQQISTDTPGKSEFASTIAAVGTGRCADSTASSCGYSGGGECGSTGCGTG